MGIKRRRRKKRRSSGEEQWGGAGGGRSAAVGKRAEGRSSSMRRSDREKQMVPASGCFVTVYYHKESNHLDPCPPPEVQTAQN